MFLTVVIKTMKTKTRDLILFGSFLIAKQPFHKPSKGEYLLCSFNFVHTYTFPCVYYEEIQENILFLFLAK